ncbi:hypothetical protein IC762_12360 [Bradyrhizobium genosp. L]|uniref:hypothetical protein n=1 Tax=Bradyrhizobium genosp. L TaxID=83637 RepID=UPI0018A2FB3A|nr:hypothetical protein [Bradyrhizobium genosp. L]QPF87037.1 hypothetical protein IC762_12360 [Bradyrhizobium genosp. L]
MNQPSLVRPARPADKSEVWRLFRLCHAENGLLPIAERKVNFYIDRLLEPANIVADDAGPRGIIGVIGEKKLEGCIMLSFGSPWYSDEINVDEFLNFVDPAHRNGNHAKTLISYAKEMIDALRGDHPHLKLMIGVLSVKRTAPKVRLYERQLTPAGAFFIYPPPENIEPPRHLYRTR